MTTCTKPSYPTYHRAMEYARKAEDLNGHSMRVYVCRHCNSWHITSRCDGVRRILDWSHSRGTFRAQFGDGSFMVYGGEHEWWASYGPRPKLSTRPFRSSRLAKEWCEAASFLPMHRWESLPEVV